MTELIRSTILGPPVGQGRPRAVRMGPLVRIHSHKASAEWESLVAQQLRAQWTRTPHDGPVRLHVLAIGKRPANVLKRDGSGRFWSQRKPDLDNIIKAVGDALVKGGVLRDDTLVASIRADSVIAADAESPRVDLVVEELEPLPLVPWPAKTKPVERPLIGMGWER